MIHRPKSQMYGFYCINVLKMAQFEKLSNKKIFEVKILKGWHPPDLENFAKIAKSKFQAVLSSLVGSVGLIWRIVIAGNDMQLLMVVKVLTKALQGPDLGHLGPILAQKCQKSRFLALLSNSVDGSDLIFHMIIVQIVFQHLAMVSGHA